MRVASMVRGRQYWTRYIWWAKQETQDAGKPFKIQPVWIFSAEIQVSLQSKELSLDEATIPWWSCLKFRMCNPKKIKYGVLVRTVCQAVSDYICKIKIHTANGQSLEDTVLSLLDRNLGQNHHIYQAIFIIVWDQFWNNVRQKSKSL